MGLANNQQIAATFVYACCLNMIRENLWAQIDQTASYVDFYRLPLFITGDYNVISNTTEKQGGISSNLLAIQDFQNCIMWNGLIDAGFIGQPFTWCNNRKGQAGIWE